MTPLPSMAPYNDAIIENSRDSRHNLRVCRDWGMTRCRSTSPKGVLKPGENSKAKLGWEDTDGYDAGGGWVQQHGCFQCVVSVLVP